MSAFLINTRLNNLNRQIVDKNPVDNPATEDLDMDNRNIDNVGILQYTALNPPIGMPSLNLQQMLTLGNDAGNQNMTGINNISSTSITTPTLNTDSIRNSAGVSFMRLEDTAGADAVSFDQNINLGSNIIFIPDASSTVFVRQGSLIGPTTDFLTFDTLADRVVLNGDFQFDPSRNALLISRQNDANGFRIIDDTGQLYMNFNTLTTGRVITMGVPLEWGAEFSGTVGTTFVTGTTIDFNNSTYYNIFTINTNFTNVSPININFINAGNGRLWVFRLNAISGNVTFTDIGLTVTPADVGKSIYFLSTNTGTITQVKYMT